MPVVELVVDRKSLMTYGFTRGEYPRSTGTLSQAFFVYRESRSQDMVHGSEKASAASQCQGCRRLQIEVDDEGRIHKKKKFRSLIFHPSEKQLN